MTDEEKAIEYCGCNQPICRKGFETKDKQNCTCARKKNYLDGFAEGEKTGKEKQWIATEKAQKKTSSKIKELEKENAELKAQIEKMKCPENCKHYLEYEIICPLGNGYCVCDKWELGEYEKKDEQI